MTNANAIEQVKATLDEVGRFMVKEYGTEPDTGQTVTQDIRKLFDKVCGAVQMLEFIEEDCEALDCTDPVVAHDVEGVPLCQGCYDACVEDAKTVSE